MAKYTLDDLMRVCSEVEFAGKTFYLRTLGARHDDKRTNAGMLRAVRMREELGDENSEAYQLRIAPLFSRSLSELQGMAKTLEEGRLRREAQRVVVPERDPRVEEGDDLHDAVTVEIDVAAEEKRLAERRAKWVEEKLAEFVTFNIEGTEEHPAWGIEEVRKHVIEAFTNQSEVLGYAEAYNEMTLMWGVYTDKKHTKPFFRSLEDVQDANPALRRALTDGYTELDRFANDTDALKNLPLGQR